MEQLNAHIRHHAILCFVRALLAPALLFLRGGEVKQYLRRAQVKLTEAENRVREWLVGLALGMDAPQAEQTRAPGKRGAKFNKASRPRSFSVLPPPLRALPAESLRTQPAPFDTRWVDQRIAACHTRAELLEAVIAQPEAYVRRLARMMRRQDNTALSLRFLGARIAVPGGPAMVLPPAISRDVPVDFWQLE